MNELQEIDKKIRSLTGESILSRPFICQGSPLGCEVAEVGINPGTGTPFWPYWNIETGFDKEGWLADYVRRQDRLKPTRDRIETLCAALAPIRCLELNLFSRHSNNEAELEKEHRKPELFNFMLNAVKPRVLLVHGRSPMQHLERLLDISLAKDQFRAATYLGLRVDVFVAKSHFSRGVSREYVRSVAGLLKERLKGAAL